MTDFLDEAELMLGSALKRCTEHTKLERELCLALSQMLAYLRSTPTAPARTEEKPPLLDVIRQFQAEAPNAFSELESPDADGGEGPSDERKCTMLACPLPYGHGGRCAVPADPANPSYEDLLQIVNHGAVDSLEQRARALYAAGRSSAARELAEIKEKLRAYEVVEPGEIGGFGVDPRDSASLYELRQIIDEEAGWDNEQQEEAGDYGARLRDVIERWKQAEDSFNSDQAPLAEKDRELAELKPKSDLADKLVALLWPYAGDDGKDEGAAECLERKLSELAELREKVKVWTPVVEAVGMATGTSDATILAMALGQFDAIPAHLRSGSGSDEGKPT